MAFTKWHLRNGSFIKWHLRSGADSSQTAFPNFNSSVNPIFNNIIVIIFWSVSEVYINDITDHQQDGICWRESFPVLFLVLFCEVHHFLLSAMSSDLSRFIPPINTHWTHQRYRMITVGNGPPEDAQDDKPRHPECVNRSWAQLFNFRGKIKQEYQVPWSSGITKMSTVELYPSLP